MSPKTVSNVIHGVVFVRTDMGRQEIPALVTHVVKRTRRTTLRSASQIAIARYSWEARNSSFKCSFKPFSRSLFISTDY